jgi:hypothetical protein
LSRRRPKREDEESISGKHHGFQSTLYAFSNPSSRYLNRSELKNMMFDRRRNNLLRSSSVALR